MPWPPRAWALRAEAVHPTSARAFPISHEVKHEHDTAEVTAPAGAAAAAPVRHSWLDASRQKPSGQV